MGIDGGGLTGGVGGFRASIFWRISALWSRHGINWRRLFRALNGAISWVAQGKKPTALSCHLSFACQGRETRDLIAVHHNPWNMLRMTTGPLPRWVNERHNHCWWWNQGDTSRCYTWKRSTTRWPRFEILSFQMFCWSSMLWSVILHCMLRMSGTGLHQSIHMHALDKGTLVHASQAPV